MSKKGPIRLRENTLTAPSASQIVPAIVAAAGEKAARPFLEFFAATIGNKNTRMAYFRAAVWFFAWCAAFS
jgi:hypothetical protein